MIDIWHLKNDISIASAGYQQCGSGVCGMRVSAILCFPYNVTLQHFNILLWHASPRCRICSGWSKWSSLRSEDTVNSPGSSVSLSLILYSHLSSFYIVLVIVQSLAISNRLLKRWVYSYNIRTAIRIGYLPECKCMCFLKVYIPILRNLVNPYWAVFRFHNNKQKIQVGQFSDNDKGEDIVCSLIDNGQNWVME